VATASANCNPNKQPNNGQCEEYGGQCSKAVDIFFNQIGNVNSKAPQNVLSYGRYCGAATKCPGSNNGLEGKGKDVEACLSADTPLDEACKEHDKCLDDSGNNPGSDTNIDPAESCFCHDQFLRELFNAQAPGTDLCDKDFYDTNVLPNPVPGESGDVPYSTFLTSLGKLALITVGAPPPLSSEAILLAAPFCSLFVDGAECSDKGYTDFEGFCGFLTYALTNLPMG